MTATERREYLRKWHLAHPGYNRKACQKWREANRERSKEFTREWRARNPEKYHAHNRSNEKLPKWFCEVCGQVGERHHPDYSEPLKVVYLCVRHHKLLHRKD